MNILRKIKEKNKEKDDFLNKLGEFSMKRTQSLPWSLIGSPFYTSLYDLYINEVNRLGFFKRKSSPLIFIKKSLVMAVIALVLWSMTPEHSLFGFLFLFFTCFLMYVMMVPSGMLDYKSEVFLRRKELVPNIIEELNNQKNIFNNDIVEKEIKINSLKEFNLDFFKNELLHDRELGIATVQLLNDEQFKKLFEDKKDVYITKYESSIEISKNFISHLDSEIEFLETIK